MVFPESYFAARDRFRAAAVRGGWEWESHPVDARGPRGEELTIEVATDGDISAPATLVVSSGLHGVEGFFGSAVQLAALELWASSPPLPGVRRVFLHSLNPYGFAWVRRANEDNVDPNRNFLLPEEEYRGCSPGYREMDALLNPRRPPGAIECFFLKSIRAVLQHGLSAVKQAVAGGQYEYPRGLFYGGSSPCQTQRVIEKNLKRWVGESPPVLHLDFHTGLGPWATFKLLTDHPLTPARQVWLEDTFGQGTVEESNPFGVSYVTRGSLGGWCHHLLGDRDYTYLCAEFGTYRSMHVLAALRAENQAHHWGRPDSVSTRRTRAQLRETFCPKSASWRRSVIAQSLTLLDQGSRALTERSPRLPVAPTMPEQTTEVGL
jgi:Protein of unknown function (DUF2817)